MVSREGLQNHFQRLEKAYFSLTVHTYNEEQAERVFGFIRGQGNAALGELLPVLAKKLAD